MLARELYDWRTRMSAEGVILTYCGWVSENVVSALGEALRRHLDADAADKGVSRRVFSVFVELVQNVIRYSGERLKDEVPPAGAFGAGLLTVGSGEGGHFYLRCANVVPRSRVETLGARLAILQTMDADALRTYYRQKLREPAEEGSQGATIGLIEIARRASRPLIWDFHEIDPETAFFCLEVHV
ncbi:MAG: SiaB family protein kinase [Alphaproteobacteria bacterium]